MNEKLLQYIWQYQYFNQQNLITEEGEIVVVLNQGNANTNQGPDFLDAKIKIDGTIWAGNIELHVNASDWDTHQHSSDLNYKNIILHVVWQDDKLLDHPFPVLVLQDKVPKLLLKKYQDLMLSAEFIPCENNLPDADELVWKHWNERLLIERMQHKTLEILDFLSENNQHWEETFWWLIARNFGAKANTETFENIAKSVSINILARHKNQLLQLEALLLGQGGLLDANFKDDYCNLLQKEYRFLKSKYKLQQVKFPLHFLRMRPSNFPSLRLAQLAKLIQNSIHLFSKVITATNLSEIRQLLMVTASDYWSTHYLPDEPSAFMEKKLGQLMMDNILINTVVPVLFAYGHHLNEDDYKYRALGWLEEIAAEKNSVTRGFTNLGVGQQTAFDSQALLQLKNNYCNKKRCLECAIGNKILKRSVSGAALL